MGIICCAAGKAAELQGKVLRTGKAAELRAKRYARSRGLQVAAGNNKIFNMNYHKLNMNF